MARARTLRWALILASAIFVFAVSGLVMPWSLRAAAAPATPLGEVTFSKDIAPILQRSCQNCHRPEGVAPMPLVTYEDARPWARSMKFRTGVLGAKLPTTSSPPGSSRSYR